MSGPAEVRPAINQAENYLAPDCLQVGEGKIEPFPHHVVLLYGSQDRGKKRNIPDTLSVVSPQIHGDP